MAGKRRCSFFCQKRKATAAENKTSARFMSDIAEVEDIDTRALILRTHSE
jgi:hypothetical protein